MDARKSTKSDKDAEGDADAAAPEHSVLPCMEVLHPENVADDWLARCMCTDRMPEKVDRALPDSAKGGAN